MELRVLEYFLAVAREQSITRAAEYLHLTQPTLSRQLRELEEEFGRPLLVRGKRKVTLTEDGQYFRKKAEEIVSLARRTEEEMKHSGTQPTGDIYIGAGETQAIHHIARVAARTRERWSGIRLHIVSGDTEDLADRLDKGLFDFCLLLGQAPERYACLPLPYRDRWGVLMPRTSDLAALEAVPPEDLIDCPLILPRRSQEREALAQWMGKPPEELNLAATYNLAYNASIMASEGIGYVVALEGLINTKGTGLCFRPLAPALCLGMSLVWKKYQVPSHAAQAFLDALEAYIAEG